VLRWLASATLAAATSAKPGLAAFSSVLKLPLLTVEPVNSSSSSSSLPGGMSGLEGRGTGRPRVWAPLGVLEGEEGAGAGPVWRWWVGDAGSLELDQQLELLTRGG